MRGIGPHFITVEEILRVNTEQTKELLRQELLIRQKELEEKIHFANLEKVFIEKRIYRDIEEAESFEQVLELIRAGLKKYFREPKERAKRNDTRLLLLRDISEEDITRLTEIRIKRISKYNSFKADELMAKLEEELAQVRHDLEHLTDYAIAWYQGLLDKYGKGRERKTQIGTFEKVEIAAVAANNTKLYVDRKEGFVGQGLKKEEFVCDCSDVDDIIVFRRDGTLVVTRIDDKTFVGKDIIHVNIWKKGDERTTYNMVYLDGKTGRAMAKRFNVTAITRDREYDLTKKTKGSKTLYFSANANGEAEVVTAQISQGAKARQKNFDFDFADLAIKSRGAAGNIMTRYPIRKVTLKEVGKSTLGAMKVWMDKVSGRLNLDGRGQYLGGFDTGDYLLVLYQDGSYEREELDLTRRYDPNNLYFIGKFEEDMVINAVYYEGERGVTLVKRFNVETNSPGQAFKFLTDHKQTKLYLASIHPRPEVTVTWREKREKKEKTVVLSDFIDVKGWKSLGNKLHDGKLASIKELNEPFEHQEEDEVKAKPKAPSNGTTKANGSIKPGSTIELDF